MSIFAILTDPSNAALERAIAATFPTDSFKVREGQFLVAAPGTAIDVSNALAVTDGTNGSAVIVTMASYYGRSNPAVWEWIKTKWGAPSA